MKNDEFLIKNISLPTFLTENGMEKLFGSDKQFIKALSPIVLTEEGIEIFLRDEHPANAHFPIYFTEYGILISVSDEHPEKAHLPIFITP